MRSRRPDRERLVMGNSLRVASIVQSVKNSLHSLDSLLRQLRSRIAHGNHGGEVGEQRASGRSAVEFGKLNEVGGCYHEKSRRKKREGDEANAKQRALYHI